MESCTATASNSSCVSVIYDDLMQEGFDNCYLQSSLGIFAGSGFAHSAWVSEFKNDTAANSTGTTSPASSSASSSSKKSLAWIAGPVVGIIAIATIGIILFTWRRKRRNGIAEEVSSTLNLSEPKVAYVESSELALDGGQVELPPSQLHELSESGQYRYELQGHEGYELSGGEVRRS